MRTTIETRWRKIEVKEKSEDQRHQTGWKTQPSDGRGHGNDFSTDEIDKTGARSKQQGHRQFRFRNTVCGVEHNETADKEQRRSRDFYIGRLNFKNRSIINSCMQ